MYRISVSSSRPAGLNHTRPDAGRARPFTLTYPYKNNTSHDNQITHTKLAFLHAFISAVFHPSAFAFYKPCGDTFILSGGSLKHISATANTYG